MILSQENIKEINSGVEKPRASCFALPEKVLQFGTGVLLRGLPDYFIDKANKQNLFNGRIVIVKSTSNGDTNSFVAQDNLYTHHIKGIENGVKKEATIVNGSISRVVSAASDWADILALAKSSDLSIIISNTTEAGLKFLPGDRITANPPVSFPGKLVAFLYERFKHFNGDAESGMVILPTELLPNNGIILKDICLQVAAENNLSKEFTEWLTSANDFCNSLVDRIVSGSLSEEEKALAEQQHKYTDDLAIRSEPYCLWAIETSRERSRNIFSFSAADAGVVISADISKFRDMKLYLLNAAHTLSCALAVLTGFKTVNDAMSDDFFEGFITSLMDVEIAGTIISEEITEEEALKFAMNVRDRFRNPYTEHQWLSISAGYTLKMLTRVVPIVLAYYKKFNDVPVHMATGFGAYIAFMHSHKNDKGEFIGGHGGAQYVINDGKADVLYDHWQHGDTNNVVHAILSDESLWNTDLTKLPGFEKAVLSTVKKFTEEKFSEVMQQRASVYSF